jgi:trans-aconitate methyltransferase
MEILPRTCFQSDLADDQAWSLLDVGCGFADLQRYMNKQHLFADYTGIDVSPDMIRGAKAMAPELNLFTGELSDFRYTPAQFDYVFLSGALNEVVETQVEGLADQQGDYARLVIAKMYEICGQGVAFNLLDRRFPWHQTRNDLQSFYPQEMLEYCQGFAAQVTLVEGYLENDFTVYLYK